MPITQDRLHDLLCEAEAWRRRATDLDTGLRLALARVRSGHTAGINVDLELLLEDRVPPTDNIVWERKHWDKQARRNNYSRDSMRRKRARTNTAQDPRVLPNNVLGLAQADENFSLPPSEEELAAMQRAGYAPLTPEDEANIAKLLAETEKAP